MSLYVTIGHYLLPSCTLADLAIFELTLTFTFTCTIPRGAFTPKKLLGNTFDTVANDHTDESRHASSIMHHEIQYEMHEQ